MAGRSRALRLTPRGWSLLTAAVVILAVATFANRREGVFIAVFLVVVVIGSAIAVRTASPRIDVARRFTPEAPARDVLDVTIELAARGSIGPVIGWSERLPPTWGSEPRGAVPPRFRANGDRAAIRYRVTPPRRGLYRLGPLSLRLRDSLGIAEAEIPSGGPAEVTVLPRITPLSRLGRVGAEGEGRQRERQALATPRIDELIAREYRAGDPVRRVHWRATARRGELMVRQEEPDGDPEALLVLDLDPTCPEGDADALVELCASAAVHLSELGFRVTLIRPGRAERVRAARQDMSRLLGVLAVVEPQAVTESAAAAAEQETAGAGAMRPVFLFASRNADRGIVRSAPGQTAVAFVAGPVDRSADRDDGWRIIAAGASRPGADAWREATGEATGGDAREAV